MTLTTLAEADVPLVRALLTTTLARVGGLPVADDPGFVGAHVPAGDGVVARDRSGEVVGAVGVRAGDAGLRGLLVWSPPDTAVLDELLDWWDRHGAGRRRELSCETVTDEVAGALAGRGHDVLVAELVMTRDLADLPAPDPGPGVHLRPWSDADRDLFFEAYQRSFRERPGFPGWSAEEWLEWTTDDDDFDPSATTLAVDDGGRPLGFVSVQADCVVQVGVVPEARGGGVGTPLLLRALQGIAATGAPRAWLTVGQDNDRAVRRYERLGFAPSGRRGRWAHDAS